MKKLICIIPALEKNNYSRSGDLIDWGNTSLLEWKISQALKVNNLEKIVVTTPSKKIAKLLRNYNVEILLRKKKLSLGALYKFVGSKFYNKKILWLNPTAPFLSDKDINEFIKKYIKHKKKFDSGFTSIELKEYLFDAKKSINFKSSRETISRAKLPTFFQSTNGAYIISGDHMKKFGTLYGKKFYNHKVSWLQSLEVKTSTELESFRFFISKYFKENI